MIIGLVPKDSLIPYVVGMVCLLSTANLLTGIISGTVVSLLGTFTDSITHRLGSYVLTFDLFEPTFAKVSSWPLMPWTRFENTVVMGSFILGLLLAYPVYRISLAILNRYRAVFKSYFNDSKIGRWILGLTLENREVTNPVSTSEVATQ